MKQSGRKLGSVIILLLALLTAYVLVVGAAELTVAEAPLNPAGRMFEVNLDDQGYLWLADVDVDEIWQVDRTTYGYTVFAGIPDPSDARRAPDGSVWWADLEQGRIGRLRPATGALTWWETPGSTGNYGINFNSSGHVWVTSNIDQLYRFNPSTSEMCSYTIPLSGGSDYVLARDDAVWLGDSANSRIYRLAPTASQFTYWELPVDSAPRGLALSSGGDFWYADPNLGQLGRLRPAQNELTLYDPPRGSLVQMIAVTDGQIWYTEHRDRTVGHLDPEVAEGTTTTISRGNAVATPTCALQDPSATATATTTNGILQWTDATYSSVADTDGWQIYELPTNSLPDGIASVGAHVWFVDPGRQVIGRIDYTGVTACVVEDEDGDVETTDDRSPLSGWTVYLTVDGVRQEPGRVTDESGCARWANLAPGEVYGVEQVGQPGWLPLGESSHNFGVAAGGVVYTHTFVNTPTDNAEELFLPLLRAP